MVWFSPACISYYFSPDDLLTQVSIYSEQSRSFVLFWYGICLNWIINTCNSQFYLTAKMGKKWPSQLVGLTRNLQNKYMSTRILLEFKIQWTYIFRKLTSLQYFTYLPELTDPVSYCYWLVLYAENLRHSSCLGQMDSFTLANLSNGKGLYL